ncbi:flagellar biosynthetic protein FliO [Rhizobacter sp. Root404]|jgi:flagellar protein FliO/FliZ|uniref:FliO/MopB family protein n=1 Tax=Rhizobacter sp. Root404 TaxID=1736528 RepID=UPI0006F4C658|nr:flagellar biosynthetic protein FliO [Rhizobacter sp. Root404]KQW40414.1 flagellar biogenesis protein [Rhizobacter sp. Root404]
MQASSGAFTSLLWFVAVIVMIPAALWLLKRTPLGGGAAGNAMRSIAALPLSANQRIVTIEVGQGDERRWLVLGVTAQSITTLHTMAPQGDAASDALPAAPLPAFAQLLGKFRQDKGTAGER